MAELLKGRPIAKKLYKEIKEKVENYKQKGLVPTLGIMLVEGDSASEIYTNMIRKNCLKAGVESKLYKFESEISEEDYLNELEKINTDDKVHGLIMMLPLPKQIDEKKVLNSINPLKDIDGVHPINAGRNVLGDEAFVPSTAQACKDILFYSNIDLSGKNVVILGRSNIVGKPLANLLMQKAEGANATVTVCHSRSKNISKICQNADVLIAAIGSANFVNTDFVNPDQLIVDVGMNDSTDQNGDYKLVGDVDFEGVKDKVAAITPVPGGVSPLTHTALLNNLLKAIKMQQK